MMHDDLRADCYRGCQSHLLGCSETCAAVVIDPEISQVDRYLGLAARDGLRIHYLIDTHTHADHFSATRQPARQPQRTGGDASAKVRRRSWTCAWMTATWCLSDACVCA